MKEEHGERETGHGHAAGGGGSSSESGNGLAASAVRGTIVRMLLSFPLLIQIAHPSACVVRVD